MATFVQLFAILAREGEPRRFTYLCGDQGVLVEQAVDLLRRKAQAQDVTLMSVDEDGAAAVWAEINQHALDADERRLVIVRNAHKLQGWEQFETWMMSKQAPNVKVVMVASERSWPMHRNIKARERLVKSTQALYVECSLSKSNPEKAAVEIITSWSRLTKEQAAFLARRTGYDLGRCRDVCRWVEMLPVPASHQLLEILSSPKPADSFVEALTRLDRAQAATMAQRLSRGEVATVIGNLAARLLDLDRIHRVMGRTLIKNGDPKRAKSETARLAEVKLDRVIVLWDAAKHYDPREVHRRTELLVMADESWTQAGVLERLTVQW